MTKYLLFAFLTLILTLSIAAAGLKRQEGSGVKFYSPYKGVYVVDVDAKAHPEYINIYLSENLETVKEISEKNNAIAALNAGFFDPSNRKTTSYVTINNNTAANPEDNNHFMNNPELKPYLKQFLNRSEFRILDCSGEIKFDIAPHQASSNGCSIKDSVQAGPELVPSLRLEEEAFVVRKNGKIIRQSAAALSKFPRSAIGIKSGHIFLVAISSENYANLPELAKIMSKLGVEKAMAFDGGSSTSMYVNLPDSEKFILNSAKDNGARRVKSAVIIKN